MGTVYLNGQHLPVEEAKISVLDRGFIFGDGVYEVVAVYAREPYRLPHHLKRLSYSCSQLGLTNPHSDSEWERILREVVARQDFDEQAVYFQVTRGVSRRDHAFPKGVAPTVFMMSSPLPLPSREQVEQGVRAVTAVDNRWHRCDVKSISLLGNVLMRQYAAERDAIETLMFRDGYLTEASASNVLLVRDGTLVAPPKDEHILPGITYDAVLELARDANLRVKVRPVRESEVWTADEVWLSSTAKEVLAITTLDGKPVGKGVPGPMFRRVWDLFQASKPKRQQPVAA
jgi:D-alanine transaminase